MKCPRCGAEVQAQRFCIYCGERLCSHDSIRVQRAPSGVMRLRHRANISQTSLPEVQKRNAENLKENKLASLSSPKVEKVRREDDYVASISSQRVQKPARTGRSNSVNISKNVTSTEGNEMKDSQSSRQSKELEALLFKLNGSGEEKAVAPEKHIDVSLLMDEDYSASESFQNDQDFSMEDEIGDIRDNGVDNSIDDMERTYSDEEYNSFFEMDEAGNEGDRDVSSSIPVGSGSFARVPSGGFNLILDSVKSACHGMIERIKSLRKTTSRKAQTNAADNKECGYYDESSKSRKYAKFAIMGAILLAIIAIIVTVSSGDKSEPAPEIAAQSTVAGNEDFAILPLDDPDSLDGDVVELTFDDDDFSIPVLDESDSGSANNAVAEESRPAENAIPSSGRLTEIRTYDQNDNVLAAVKTGENFKTKNSCIMRQGPASRFGLVKQIPAGSTIQILTNVDEDWVLQGGSVWTKAGHNPKLGPGDQFADALKGMKLPQPKSRVISAKNWKYVQFGKVYGYVGPACFK